MFLKYLGNCKAQYLYLRNEAAKVELRKTVKKHVAGMSREAVKALLDAPSQKSKTGRAVFRYGIRRNGVDKQLALSCCWQEKAKRLTPRQQ